MDISVHSKHGGCLSYDTVKGALLQQSLSASWIYLKKACHICYKRCGCNIRTWRNPGEALQVHRGGRDMAICHSEQETHYTTWPVVGYQPLVSVGNCNHSNTSRHGHHDSQSNYSFRVTKYLTYALLLWNYCGKQLEWKWYFHTGKLYGFHT